MTHATITMRLDADNPWPGLESYCEDAQGFFYGRVHECQKLLKKVLDAPVTVLFGRSGLGKTSLLHAGLFPLLRNENYLPIYVRFDLKPGAASLSRQLHEAIRNAIQAEAPDAVLPGDDESLWEYLHRADLELWSARNYLLTPVILLDQFEELFTLGEGVPDEVEAFKYDLADLAENRIPADLAARIKNDPAEARRLNLRSHNCKLLISLREDFLAHLEDWCRFIPALGRSRMRLLPLGTDEAFDAVYKPAQHLMTPELAHQVVGIIAGEGLHPGGESALGGGDCAVDRRGAADVEPTLLSLVCRELNEERKRLGKATFDEQLIEEHGRSTIPNYYISCVGGMRPEVAEFIENQLITKTGFRDFEAVEDAVPSHLTHEELDQLIDSRLVRLAEYHGTQRIELIHDVLTGTVRDHRDRRRLEDEKAEVAARAEQEKRTFEEAAERHRTELDRERRAGRKLKWLSVALALVCAAALTFGLLAIRSTKNAENRLNEALAERLSARGQSMLFNAGSGSEMEAFSKILAAQKLSTKPGIGPLLTALITKPRLEKVVDLPAEGGLFSGDGKWVFTTADGGVQKVNAETGDLVGKPFGDRMSELRAVSWNGRYIVVAQGDSDVHVWDTDSGTPVGEAIASSVPMTRTAVSSEGNRVASAEITGDVLTVTVRLWNTQTGQEIARYRLSGDYVRDLKFSPNGRTLAIGTWFGTVMEWDGTQQVPRRLTPPGQPATNLDNSVRNVAFSPDGRTIAAGGSEGAEAWVRVWDAETGEVRSHIPSPEVSGNPGDVSVGFNADGTRVVTGGSDGNVRIIDVAGQKQIGDTIGFMEPVTQVAFHGNRIATISGQSLSMSDATPDATLAAELPGSKSPYRVEADGYALYVDSDGPRIAAIRDNTLRWLNPDTGEQMGPTMVSDALRDVAQIEQGSDIELALGISRDRQWLALAGPGAGIRVIDAATGDVRASLNQAGTGRVSQVAFSPDGDTLASVGDDRKIRLWDWRNGNQLSAADTEHIPSAVAFSEDGDRVYSRGIDSVQIWDDQLQPVGEPITGHLITAWAFADGPGGEDTMAVVDVIKGNYVIQQYDASSGQNRGQPLTGHIQNIVSIVYTLDGRYLVSVGRDASVRFWDASSGEQAGMNVPIRPVGEVSYVAASDDGRKVFVTAMSVEDRAGSHGGGIWEIPGPGAWTELVCDKLASNLTEEQWNRLISNDSDLDAVDYDAELCPGK
ncbi:hypothetical protein JVX93_09990 [Mycolicibacterium boenickei]|nr:hypothetical protein JVX93_09990 [Mycolicibacterium boenickei]